MVGKPRPGEGTVVNKSSYANGGQTLKEAFEQLQILLGQS
jgi:hypothetical protein